MADRICTSCNAPWPKAQVAVPNRSGQIECDEARLQRGKKLKASPQADCSTPGVSDACPVRRASGVELQLY
eukprot:scaffold954_cov221-Pinguiococcus_pyrenoidosus.AAC.6